MAATTYTTADIAAKLEVTPRELRKFLREDAASRDAATPGKGSRYTITGKELRPLTARFNRWVKAQAEAKAAKVSAATEVPETDAEVDALIDA